MMRNLEKYFSLLVIRTLDVEGPMLAAPFQGPIVT